MGAGFRPQVLFMNAPLIPEVLLRCADEHQPALPLATSGVARWVWHSRFGSMLIEVVEDTVFVNGQAVVAHAAPTPPQLGRHGLVSSLQPDLQSNLHLNGKA